MKKLLVWIVGILVTLGVSNAQSLILSTEGDGNFGEGCIVPVDIYMNTKGKNVIGTDLVLVSSMDYIDFVPNKNLFPYFLKPMIDDSGIISIGGFSLNSISVDNGKIGTLYFKGREGDVDGIVRRMFVGEGETADTNLVSPEKTDILNYIENLVVTFSDDMENCIDSVDLSGGYIGLTDDDVLDEIVGEIGDKIGNGNDNFFKGLYQYYISNKIILTILLLIIVGIIIFLLLKYKKSKGEN